MGQDELELRKLAITEKELSLKEKEIELKLAQEQKKSALVSPLGVAAVGGVLALLSGVFGNLIQSYSNAESQKLQHKKDIELATTQHTASSDLERQKERAELILRALDTKGDTNKAAENLEFMLNAGLIEDNEKLRTLIAQKQVPSISLPRISLPDKWDLSNATFLAAREEAEKLLTSDDFPRVLPDAFFFKILNQVRDTELGKFTAASTPKVYLVVIHLAKEMLDVARKDGIDHRAIWEMMEDDVLLKMQAQNEFGESVLSPNESEVWRQVLREWRTEVNRVDSTRFKDALIQAAYMFARAIVTKK